MIAGLRAPTLRLGVQRLVAELSISKAGTPFDVAREWVASTFDLAIEVARLRDGRHRVMRVAELSVVGGQLAVRDVFTFTVERTAAAGAIDGTFQATGLVPAILEDIASRGIPIERSPFARHGRSESPISPR
jgi:pilus assembly protein CpaF